MAPVEADKRIPFGKTPTGLARVHPTFGVQEVIAKHCMQQGDVFITMRSGQRMIAFSLTYDEFDAIADVVDALAEAGEDSKDT